MARALAIVGMVMVHVGPQELPGGGLVGAAYRSSHGRAAIGFIVLAGIGVSMLAGDRAPPRLAGASLRLTWRAVLLLPAGLALQALDINVAVILQYYAVYFVVAIVALRLTDRGLVRVVAASATLGPAALIWLERTAPALFQPGVPRWYEVGRIARDILVTGYYPVIVWTAPLLLGIWLGRRDLRSAATTRLLVVAGACSAATGFVLSDALVAWLGPATSSGDWAQLYMIEPHNEMPLWLLTSTAIAVTVTALCLGLCRALPRVTWPLVALGQLALTTYVLHLLVLNIWPQWLLRADYVPAWLSVARFTVISLLLATAYRAVAARGPFEVVLRAPWLTAAAVEAER